MLALRAGRALGSLSTVRQGQAYYGFKRQDHVREPAYNSALRSLSWDFNLRDVFRDLSEIRDEIRVLDELSSRHRQS